MKQEIKRNVYVPVEAPSVHVQTQQSYTTSPPAKQSESLLLFLVSTPPVELKAAAPARSSGPACWAKSQSHLWRVSQGLLGQLPGVFGLAVSGRAAAFQLADEFLAAAADRRSQFTEGAAPLQRAGAVLMGDGTKLFTHSLL